MTTTILSDILDTDLLQWCIGNRYVNATRHATEPLTIYNYAPSAQYERLWNDVTLQCRGLIVADSGEAVARPFRKFFNIEEHAPEEIPKERFDVFEKLDGSLGILYWVKGEPCIATRGSFHGEQAARGQSMIDAMYRDECRQLPRDLTFLFEIIYPENRIVVDYGEESDLFALASINIATGRDDKGYCPDIFRYVPMHDGINTFDELTGHNEANREGFVLRFESGFRVKVKFEEYVRLHRIVTGVSTKTIWECLRDGDDMGSILDRVPDEFYQWARSIEGDLRTAFNAVERAAKQEFRTLPTRKETALYFQQCTHPAILFRMLDGRSYDDIIWKTLRPGFSRPFRNEIEA